MSRTNVVIEAVGWSPAVEAMLAPVGQSCVKNTRRQVEEGSAQLFVVVKESQAVGVFALRIDRLAGGDDGVIVAAAGRDRETDFIGAVLPVIEQMFNGCARVRVHTERPGLAKILAAQHAYRLQELVLVKDLTS